MSTIDTSPSNNGRGSDAWLQSWTHLGIARCSPGYCRVTFDHPPSNAITATTVMELAELVDLIHDDADLNVVVFDSANPRFYLTHDDVGHEPSPTAPPPLGPSVVRAWHELIARLSHAPAVSIAPIRGQVGGAGIEFVLACDLRFASLESALLGQFRVGSRPVPGSGSMTRLSRMAGRERALEILLVGDELDARRAEQYGCVNRLIPDDRLDDEIDRIASRLAHLDHDAIARTKAAVG